MNETDVEDVREEATVVGGVKKERSSRASRKSLTGAQKK